MAYVIQQYCNECESITYHTNGKCDNCSIRENRLRIASWNALTTEEKLQDLRIRIERLEAGPPTY